MVLTVKVFIVICDLLFGVFDVCAGSGDSC